MMKSNAWSGMIFTPPDEEPGWGVEEIAASRILHQDQAALPAEPQHQADPLNLFVVVESGDHHVSILDGDRLGALIERFPSRFALHGGPKFSPDGPLRLFRIARRLDHQVRPLWPAAVGGGSGRLEYPQPRNIP